MTDDLARIMAEVNMLLGQDLPGGRFVTAFFGVLDPAGHSIQYVSAGHGPLLYFDAAQREGHTLPATTLPLGIVPEIDCASAPPLLLNHGDLLILVTDGFFEWTDPDGDQFGTERIFDLVRADLDASPAELIRRLHAAVVEFGRGTVQADDLTAIIVKRI
jgi:phosphoserine phosphatase